MAEESNRVGDIETLDFPWVSMGEPIIWHLELVAILADLLEEHSVLVSDTVSPTRIVECCEGVHEAGCETPQAAVSETWIALFGNDIFELVTKSEQRLLKVVSNAQVHQGVLEVPTHKELQREVINALDVPLREELLGVVPRLEKPISDGIGRGLVRTKGVKVVSSTCERVLDMVDDLSLDSLWLTTEVLRHEGSEELVPLLGHGSILWSGMTRTAVPSLRLRDGSLG
mmetsp:Transcript_3131/g.5401  ORF Transcript_3131/g.5401 Transcript_3131/m.5401 type:complete len:228 (-) Transcript_3131:258-941(-)